MTKLLLANTRIGNTQHDEHITATLLVSGEIRAAIVGQAGQHHVVEFLLGCTLVGLLFLVAVHSTSP